MRFISGAVSQEGTEALRAGFKIQAHGCRSAGGGCRAATTPTPSKASGDGTFRVPERALPSVAPFRPWRPHRRGRLLVAARQAPPSTQRTSPANPHFVRKNALLRLAYQSDAAPASIR